jgi:hypothetical protein
MQVKKMIYTRKDSLKKRGEKTTRTQGEEDTGKVIFIIFFSCL